MIEERILKAKCMEMLRQYDDVLKMIIEDEIDSIRKGMVGRDSEFETIKAVFKSEGIQEGLRRVLQRINEYASRDII